MAHPKTPSVSRPIQDEVVDRGVHFVQGGDVTVAVSLRDECPVTDAALERTDAQMNSGVTSAVSVVAERPATKYAAAKLTTKRAVSVRTGGSPRSAIWPQRADIHGVQG